MKKARLIYNPISGKGMIKKFLPDILNKLENFGYEASAFATTAKANSAKKEAGRVANKGFDLIIAAGGDGTINEVVNGIASLSKRPRLAIIPAGTTNDYARALKLPRNNPLAAIEILSKQQTIKMDVGKVKDRYFINIAAGGGLSELTFQVPPELKKVFGYLAYMVKGAEMLPQIKPVDLRITYDGGIYEGSTSMFFVSLTNSVGGFESLAPDAKLDDGKFTLLIIKQSNIFEILRIMAGALNGGKHLNDPKVIYQKTSKLFVEPLDNNQLMINLDGDYGGDAPVEMVNLQQHLEIFANVDAINNDSLLGEKDEYSQIAYDYVQELENVINEDLDGDGKIGGQKLKLLI